MSNATLRRRIDALAATAPPACPDAWHDGPGKFAVVYEDVESRVVPEPPTCPTCGSAPNLTIIVAYERIQPALDGGIELRRTALRW